MSCILSPKNDHYLGDIILPEGNSTSVKYPEYFNENLHRHIDLHPQSSNVPDDYFQNLRNIYITQLKKVGNNNLDIEDLFFGFPIKSTESDELLGTYMYNLPFCKFLQKSVKDKDAYELLLDNNSIHNELNVLSSIIRESIEFLNVKLTFKVIDSPNKLKLLFIEHNNEIILRSNSLWISLIQSAFTQLFLIMSIEHAIWHLVVAHIIHISRLSLCFTEIKKIFDIASNNVFIKALEVKLLLFGTPFVFQQILNKNEKFIEYIKLNVKNLIINFNIDTIFDEYFNIGTKELSIDKSINWIPGMKSNILIIKEFVDKIILKYNLNYENFRFKKIIEKTYKSEKITADLDIKKLLQILFVVGTAFHSTTFQFTKLIFTDVFYNKQLTKAFYNIAIQTIVGDFNVVFGDLSLYKGSLYLDEVLWLNKTLEENRLRICKCIDKSDLFRNSIFSTKESMSKYIAINTYTTNV